MHRSIMTAALLAMSVGIAPAFAQDADDSYNRDRTYAGHYQLHDDLENAHERAHDDGFYSRSEHRSFHRALRYLHSDYHEGYSYGDYPR